MPTRQRQEKPIEERTLGQLCNLVIGYKYAFEDLAEFIEDKAFGECDSKRLDKAVHHLGRVAEFFELMENKNEENCRDLVDIYILIGEIYQCDSRFDDSIEWFRKAIVANDRHPSSFHCLATSYIHLGDLGNAARSLEQEIHLAPGNYYSYLLLADLYEQLGDEAKTEETVNRLLDRDPDNIQALHKIYVHYRQAHPEADVELLQRRIISAQRDLNKVETIIWTYHMCREGRLDDALNRLTVKEDESPDLTIVHLLKAYIYGVQKQYSRKRAELTKFKNKNSGKGAFMSNKLKEFEDVFGEKAAARLIKRLTISSPSKG
jgi:tetratricopeptide (TPR) repeat protein